MISPIKTIITNNTTTDFKLLHYPDCQIFIAAKGDKEFKGDIFSTIANDRERIALMSAAAKGVIAVRYEVDGIAACASKAVNEVLALPASATKQIGIKIEAKSAENIDQPADDSASVTAGNGDKQEDGVEDSDAAANDVDTASEEESDSDSADASDNTAEASADTESVDVVPQTETVDEERGAEAQTDEPAKNTRRRSKNIQIG